MRQLQRPAAIEAGGARLSQDQAHNPGPHFFGRLQGATVLFFADGIPVPSPSRPDSVR